MTQQAPLFDASATPALTERQAHALDAVTTERDGISTIDIGATMHARRGKHAADVHCDWCEPEGRSVLVELRRKRLVIQRRKLGGLWFATAAHTPPDASFGEFPEGY